MSDDEPRFCDECGTRLQPSNVTHLCLECQWTARDKRLRAAEREAQRQRRREAVAQRLANLDEKTSNPKGHNE